MSAALTLAFAERIAAALVAGGVRDVVLSPGSRNTPLVLALAARADVRAHSVLDERVAGFVGLGLARASGRPVALLCTSGSAGAHYYPALLEAEACGTPLLAVTADRPPELQGRGAPQTMDQRRLFGAHARAVELGPPGDAPTRDAELEASLSALLAGDGPMHVNVAFREPLWEPGLRAQARPLPETNTTRAPRRLEDAVGIARSFAGCRGAIVCGPRVEAAPVARTTVAERVFALGRALGWPVLVDPASGLRFGPHADEAIGAYDGFLRDDGVAEALRPEVVLRLGRVPTSKSTQRWLEGAQRIVLVDPLGRVHDPSGRAEPPHVADPASFCQDVLAALAGEGDAPEAGWLARWRRVELETRAVLAEHAARGLWEGAIARAVCEALPEGSLLHVASSMPIRDLDAFAPPSRRALRVLSNRGLNGIDGNLATTFGEALADPGPTTLLCGDLTFLHDAGALLAARGLGVEATIVVIDNGGGGIFSFLPIAEHPRAFERWFLTPQRADLRALCAAAGVRWDRVDDPADLSQALAAPAGLRVIEVPVDRVTNVERHRDAFAAAARAARACLEEPAVAGRTA